MTLEEKLLAQVNLAASGRISKVTMLVTTHAIGQGTPSDPTRLAFTFHDKKLRELFIIDSMNQEEISFWQCGDNMKDNQVSKSDSMYAQAKCDDCGEMFEPSKIKYRKNYRKYLCFSCFKAKNNSRNSQFLGSIHSDDRQIIRNINLYSTYSIRELLQVTSKYPGGKLRY